MPFVKICQVATNVHVRQDLTEILSNIVKNVILLNVSASRHIN